MKFPGPVRGPGNFFFRVGSTRTRRGPVPGAPAVSRFSAWPAPGKTRSSASGRRPASSRAAGRLARSRAPQTTSAGQASPGERGRQVQVRHGPGERQQLCLFQVCSAGDQPLRQKAEQQVLERQQPPGHPELRGDEDQRAHLPRTPGRHSPRASTAPRERPHRSSGPGRTSSAAAREASSAR